MATNTNQDAMEFIWDRIPKQKDGKTIKYLSGDVDYLYAHGFVDTKKFKLEEWHKAFDPFKQKDGSFILTKKQFMSLRMFRYTGPSGEVFDALRIKPGPWTDEQLQELYDRSIGVASTLPEKSFWTFVNALKKKSSRFAEDGRFYIDMRFRVGLDALIKLYPSPRTLLELEVRRLRLEKDKAKLKSQLNRDSSKFMIGESEAENKTAAFEKMKSTSKQKQEQPKKEEQKETIDIKSLKKPSKTFRG